MDVLEQDQELAVDQPQDEVVDGEGATEVVEQPEDNGDLVVQIGDSPSADDEEDHPDDNERIRSIRAAAKANAARAREAERKARELEGRVAQFEEQAKPAATALGPKPTLESFDYDADSFDSALDAWYAKKSATDKEKAEQESQKAAEFQQFQAKVDSYTAGRDSIKARAKDFDAVEADVKAELSVMQQNILLMHGDKPEITVYGLGKNRAELSRLSSIKDPIKFAMELGRIEAKRNVTSRPRAEVQVEKTISSNVSGASERLLGQALAKAEKSGSLDEYRRLKRELNKG